MIAFIVRGNGLNGDQIRDALVAAVPAIGRRARQLQPPIICHVHRDGRVEVIRGVRKGGVKQA